ncbi:hypothetical protein HZU73_10049 [Apis mellifera caucasica]|nr:hypothetical protein HZU73_10049 [Apis mellifera caucasica]
MTNPLRDARPEDRPLGLDYPDPRLVRNGHQEHQGNTTAHQIGAARIRRTRTSSTRRRMHLANEVPPQGSTGGNNLPDYALTADLLTERTLDGLFAEHPGELVRTEKKRKKELINSATVANRLSSRGLHGITGALEVEQDASGSVQGGSLGRGR